MELLGECGPLLCMLLGELLGIFHEFLFVLGVFLSQVSSEGMLWFGVRDERCQRLDNLVGLGSRFPVIRRDNWQANLTLLVDIGVVDLRFECDLWGLEGVFSWKIDVDFESTLVVGC